MEHAGIVLAAGASTRMGQPKALLQTPEGEPLARQQVELLKQAGCHKVMLVLGCDAQKLQASLPTTEAIENTAWETGRLSSVLCGLKATIPFDGCFILPVDAVRIQPETLARMKAAAEEQSAPAVRPTFGGHPGKLVWISKTFALQLLEGDIEPEDDRLDLLLAPLALCVEVPDSAILNNINTPDEWQAAKHTWND